MLPPAWESLLGEYEIEPRIRSRYSDAETLGRVQIVFEDGILQMDGANLILLPVSERQILIVGGIFDGERVVRDPDTGILEWGSRRYVPQS